MTRSLILLLALVGCPPGEEPSETGEPIDTEEPATDADGDGWSVEDGDCDDADAAISPDGEEICDEIDNDCDGETDEGLDQTWYADSDEDGYGDPDVTETDCAQPSGFVDNADDCDDTLFSGDLDDDGTWDCEDEDQDGDGILDAWEIDPRDPAETAGLVTGRGLDGPLTVTGDEMFSELPVLVSGGAAAGSRAVTLAAVPKLEPGDEVMILSQQGADAGRYGMHFVSAVTETEVTLASPLAESYAADSVVIVQRIPHFTEVDISGRLSTAGWEGAGGGVIAFRATGNVEVAGSIDLEGLGFRGGTVGGDGPEGPEGYVSEGGGDGGNGGGYDGCNTTTGAQDGGDSGGDGGAHSGANGTGGGGGYGTGGGGGGGGTSDGKAGADGGDGLSGTGLGGASSSGFGGGGGGGGQALDAPGNTTPETAALLNLGGGGSAGAGGGGAGFAGYGNGGYGGQADGTGGLAGNRSCNGRPASNGSDGGDAGSGGGVVMVYAESLGIPGEIALSGKDGGFGGDGGDAAVWSHSGKVECSGGGGGGGGGNGAASGVAVLAARTIDFTGGTVEAEGGAGGPGGAGGATACGTSGRGGNGMAGQDGATVPILLWGDTVTGEASSESTVVGTFSSLSE